MYLLLYRYFYFTCTLTFLFCCILSVYMCSPLNLFGYWTLNKHYYYYINVCNSVVFSVVDLYLDHLKLFVVYMNGGRYVCCS